MTNELEIIKRALLEYAEYRGEHNTAETISEALAAVERLEMTRDGIIADYIDRNSVTCDCCQHVMIDVTAAKDGEWSHCVAGDPEGEGIACAHGWHQGNESLELKIGRLEAERQTLLVGWRYKVLVDKHATGDALPGEISMLDISRQAVWGKPGQWRYSDGPNKPDVDWMCEAEPLYARADSAERQSDTELLDWLEDHPGSVLRFFPTGDGWRVIDTSEKGYRHNIIAAATHIRAAIDAAIKSTKESAATPEGEYRGRCENNHPKGQRGCALCEDLI